MTHTVEQKRKTAISIYLRFVCKDTLAKLGAPTTRNAQQLVSSGPSVQAGYLPKSHLTCGWNKGEEDFPEEGHEVHDIVPTRR